MGMSNGRDTLQRVAFEDSNGTFFKFAINPQDMEESILARNNFMKTQDIIQMQGYGQGLHTITISGTTGVNHGKGVDKLNELKRLIVNHINQAHDTQAGEVTDLTFHNFTNNVSYKVEMNQDGIKITQSSSDPLSLKYSISMVVIQSADQPSTTEETWIQLGNINPSLTPRAINSSYEYKYGTTALKDFDFNGIQTEAGQFKASKQGVINNYGQSGMYQEDKSLSKAQIVSLYKTVYGKTLPNFDFNKYVDASGMFSGKKKGTVSNYGQTDSGDAVKILPPADVDTMYQRLYGNTVNAIDYASFSNLSQMFKSMKHGTIEDYGQSGQADTDDDTLTVGDAVDMYSAIYGKTVADTNYNSYENASGLFSQAKKETINNYGQSDVEDAMFKSYANYQVQKASDLTNSWEQLTSSSQVKYGVQVKDYINPLVSKESATYTYHTINNMLKV